MNLKALLFTIIGAIVAVVYALESLLFFQANGLAVPLLFKLLICAAGIYVFLHYVTKIRKK
jgi:hypothetical protein